MKYWIYICLIFELINFKQANCEKIHTSVEIINSNTNDTLTKNIFDDVHKDESDFQMISLSEYEKVKLYNLTDTILADFNGDGFLDKAYFNNISNNSGIIIKSGKTKKTFKIGFNKNFSTWKKFDCHWVEYWGLVEDKVTFETTFDKDGDVLGGKEVKLQNPSIVLGKYESGGGLITFLNGKFVWIHQTC